MIKCEVNYREMSMSACSDSDGSGEDYLYATDMERLETLRRLDRQQQAIAVQIREMLRTEEEQMYVRQQSRNHGRQRQRPTAVGEQCAPAPLKPCVRRGTQTRTEPRSTTAYGQQAVASSGGQRRQSWKSERRPPTPSAARVNNCQRVAERRNRCADESAVRDRPDGNENGVDRKTSRACEKKANSYRRCNENGDNVRVPDELKVNANRAVRENTSNTPCTASQRPAENGSRESRTKTSMTRPERRDATDGISERRGGQAVRLGYEKSTHGPERDDTSDEEAQKLRWTDIDNDTTESECRLIGGTDADDKKFSGYDVPHKNSRRVRYNTYIVQHVYPMEYSWASIEAVRSGINRDDRYYQDLLRF